MNEMHDNILQLQNIIKNCTLCPRRCQIDRTAGQIGFCRIGATAKAASVSRNVIEIVTQVAPGSAINVMAQYHPCYRAREFPQILDLLSFTEIHSLRNLAMELGLFRVDH
jgi:uncharacterized Fe-S radical SAM superfamily protein PflX